LALPSFWGAFGGRLSPTRAADPVLLGRIVLAGLVLGVLGLLIVVPVFVREPRVRQRKYIAPVVVGVPMIAMLATIYGIFFGS
jgi:hypothetical protein